MVKENKNHKKKHKLHKKRKHLKHRSSDSSSSSNSGDEWVELAQVPSTSVPQTSNDSGMCEKRTQDIKTDSENDWLSNSTLFPCISRSEIRQKTGNKEDKNEVDKYMLDKLGQTDRELNPYWKDGGSGLPEERQETPDSLRQAAVTVGDQGVAWLRKALQRAKEQAAEQGRPLDQVVAERWGSLEKLQFMIGEAEKRETKTVNSEQNNASKYKSNSYKLKNHSKIDDRKTHFRNEETKRRHSHNDRHSDDKFKKPCNRFKKPTTDSDDEDTAYNKSKSNHKSNRYSDQYDRHNKFMKPAELNSSSEDENSRHTNKYVKWDTKNRRKDSNESTKYSYEKSKKEELNNKRKHKKTLTMKESKRKHRYSSESSDSSTDDTKDHKYSNKKTERLTKSCYDDDNELSENPFKRLMEVEDSNTHSSTRKGWRKKAQSPDIGKKSEFMDQQQIEQLSKKDTENKIDPVEKLQILSDKELNELGAKLVKAELLGNEALAKELKEKLERAREAKANVPKEDQVSAEVVVLTHTDARGFTRPVSLSGPLEPTGGRRKAKKVETHEGGKRTRYFADDDKYSLQEMFQREKFSTVEDSNAVFAKLASKGVGRDDSARDMDDVFEETARVEEADGRRHARERQQAIEHSKRTARSLDNCQWCLESKEMLKHLIVAMGKTCYLCVPPHQSLTDNHCLLVPSYHSPCATQLDEDVWREMQDFRKSVVQLFHSQGEDVVFFESARYLNKLPHMVIHCVPMPKETGDLAPIYFKKAIQECEMEWSNNKKLVELKGRDVRKAVPRGLPYFAVDFGMDSGFAHVIEDEKLFPHNFAQEIIGGMLDLDHTIWRKQKKQPFEEQSRKVIQLIKLWKPFDCTQQNK